MELLFQTQNRRLLIIWLLSVDKKSIFFRTRWESPRRLCQRFRPLGHGSHYSSLVSLLILAKDLENGERSAHPTDHWKSWRNVHVPNWFGVYVDFAHREGCEVLWSVCLSACLSVCISQKQHGWTSANFLSMSVGSVLFWQRYDTSCTSGCVDDVMSTQNGLYSVSCVFWSVAAETTSSISTKFWSTITISRWLCTIGQSLQLPCLHLFRIASYHGVMRACLRVATAYCIALLYRTFEC